jgi:hypothetical protein
MAKQLDKFLACKKYKLWMYTTKLPRNNKDLNDWSLMTMELKRSLFSKF